MGEDGMESRRVSPTPKSDLDYNMMTTDPAWGQSFIPQELKKKLSEQFVEEKTVKTEQIILPEFIDKNIQTLLDNGFEKSNDNTFIKSTDIQKVIVTVNRTTGSFEMVTTSKSVTNDGYWEILGYYTRDLRLGNLDDGANPFKSNEVAYCEYHLNLAGDELNFYHKDLPHGFHKVFFAHIRRVASKIEISHSKHGWFRKQSATVTQNMNYSGEPPDPKIKNWFGASTGGNKNG